MSDFMNQILRPFPKSCHLDHYVDLRLARAELLDISDTIVRDIIDLEPYDFPVKITTLEMSGMRLIGKAIHRLAAE